MDETMAFTPSIEAEVKRAPSRVPLLLAWLLILTSMASFRIRQADELFQHGGVDAQVIFQVATWCTLGMLALVLVWTGRADLRLLGRGPVLWYLAFVVVAALSAAASMGPALTLFRAGQHGIALLLVISMREHLHKMYTYIIAYVAVSWILLFMAIGGFDFNQEWIYRYVRGQSFFSGDFMQRWRFETAYAHPSLLSIVAAVGAIGMAARAKGRSSIKERMIIAWLIATAVLTVSRTAILGMVLGLGVVALSRKSLFTWLCLILVPASALMVSSDVRQGIGHYLARGQTSSELASLTGRSFLYRVALNRIDRSLPWGEGFQSGRLNPLEEDNATMVHAHNLLLEATAGMGYLGGLAVALVVLTWLMNLMRLFNRSTDSDATSWELCAVSVPLLAFCVLDSGFANAINAVVFVYMAVIARTQLAWVDRVEGRAGEARESGFSATPAMTTC
jgi:hypothetical protein